MARSNLTKLYVGDDYSTTPETNADITSIVMGLTGITTAERDALVDPQAGWIVYNSTTNLLNFYNGTTWGAV